MEVDKNVPDAPEIDEKEKPRPPTISRERWISRRTHPKLVHFSWGAVIPMNSQR